MYRFWIYIMSNRYRGTIYVGVTNNVYRRVPEHKTGDGGRFTSKYNLTRLVHYEEFTYVKDAIAREKQLKNWKRDWKINLIEEDNPNWDDLSEDWK